MNEDLRAAERAFNDVHKKYERTKEAIGEFKRNEDSLKVRCNLNVQKLYATELYIMQTA